MSFHHFCIGALLHITDFLITFKVTPTVTAAQTQRVKSSGGAYRYWLLWSCVKHVASALGSENDA